MTKEKRKNKEILLKSVLLLLLATGIFAAGYMNYKNSLDEAITINTLAFMQEISNRDLNCVTKQLEESWSNLKYLEKRLDLNKNSNIQNLYKYLAQEAATCSFEELYLIDENGNVYSSHYQDHANVKLLWEKGRQQGKENFISQYKKKGHDKIDYLMFSHIFETPVQWEKRNFIGLIGSKELSVMEESMELNSFSGMGNTVVIEQDGTVIAGDDNKKHMDYKEAFVHGQYVAGDSYAKCQEKMKVGETFSTRLRYGEQEHYVSLQPIVDTNWYLVVTVDEEVVDSQVQVFMVRSIMFVAILALTIGLCMFYLILQNQKTKAALESENAKTIFLSNMSHEIRTPLNGIVGLHYLMQTNMDNREKMSEYMDKIKVSVEYLRDLVNDILDMSKIENGQLELLSKPVNLETILDEVSRLMMIQAEEKKIHFEMSSNILNASVLGDAMRVKQILVNVIGNAIKFTAADGNVGLYIKQEIMNGKVETTFVIFDEGCGISKEFVKRIWNPFEQENRSQTQKGTGLGMTLSKTLVEKMGGQIMVESEEKVGSTFTIIIPFEVCEESVEEITHELDKEWLRGKGKRVLIVEDNELNLGIITEIMSNLGYTILTAINGKEAVDVFQKSSVDEIDAILMDVHMPVMNGYEATRNIRALSREDAAVVPIIALTASTFQDDINRALDSGMNHVIAKPLDIQQLMNIFAE